MSIQKTAETLPSMEEIQAEMKRVDYLGRYRRSIRNTILTLIVLAAAVVLAASFWFPVLRVYSRSMAPTLAEGEYILTIKTSNFDRGDVVAFYYNNKILIRRVIGLGGDVINIRPDGTVIVNGEELEETYLRDKALGNGDMEFPYEVPINTMFVLGDNRAATVDSRHTVIGAVEQEQIVGRLLWRLWPMKRKNQLTT